MGWNIQCELCAEEHEQLAGWLEELKMYREKGVKEHMNDIGLCKYCSLRLGCVPEVMCEEFGKKALKKYFECHSKKELERGE